MYNDFAWLWCIILQKNENSWGHHFTKCLQFYWNWSKLRCTQDVLEYTFLLYSTHYKLIKTIKSKFRHFLGRWISFFVQKTRFYLSGATPLFHKIPAPVVIYSSCILNFRYISVPSNLLFTKVFPYLLKYLPFGRYKAHKNLVQFVPKKTWVC